MTIEELANIHQKDHMKLERDNTKEKQNENNKQGTKENNKGRTKQSS